MFELSFVGEVNGNFAKNTFNFRTKLSVGCFPSELTAKSLGYCWFPCAHVYNIGPHPLSVKSKDYKRKNKVYDISYMI